MAWTTPRTWTSGELVTAAIMNSAVRDNLSMLDGGRLAITSQATGDIVFCSSSTALSRLAKDAGKFLKSGASSVSWGEVSTVPTILTKTTTYAIVDGDGKTIVVKASTAGGAWTLTLLAASTAAAGARVTVVKTTNDVNALTIDGASSETINGSTTQTLSWLDETMSIVCDGSNWIIENRTPDIISLPCTMAKLDNTTSEITMFAFPMKANQFRPGDSLQIITAMMGYQYAGSTTVWSWDLAWGGNEFDLFALSDTSRNSMTQNELRISLFRSNATPTYEDLLVCPAAVGGWNDVNAWTYDEDSISNSSCDFTADVTVALKVTSDTAHVSTEIVPWSCRVLHFRGSQSGLEWD